jgi:hypothetical protein
VDIFREDAPCKQPTFSSALSVVVAETAVEDVCPVSSLLIATASRLASRVERRNVVLTRLGAIAAKNSYASRQNSTKCLMLHTTLVGLKVGSQTVT